MHFTRTAAISLLLLAAASLQGFSQEKTSLWKWLKDRAVTPAKALDTEAVYQPAPTFHIGISGDLRRAGMSQKCQLTYGDEDMAETYVLTDLRGVPSTGIGLHMGYGNLSLAWNKKVGVKDKQAIKTISFEYVNPGYAVQLQYFGFKKPINYEVGVSRNGHNEVITSGETLNPGHITAFITDAFYSFNRSGFAYSAVYKGNVIQKRTAGSFMLGTKFIQGMIEYEPEELISGMMLGLTRQATVQASLGGGFSYNHVLLHHQPGADGTGLRNLTLNATAIPMLTVVNRFASTIQKVSPEGNSLPEKNRTNGKMRVNYVAKVGAIYSLDHFFVSLTGGYDSFLYSGVTDVTAYDLLYEAINSSGRFFRWSTSLKFCVKF